MAAVRFAFWRFVATWSMAANLITVALAVVIIGPRIESATLPIIGAQEIGERFRTPRLACAEWSFIRKRAAGFYETDLKIDVLSPAGAVADTIDAQLLIRDGDALRYFKRSKTSEPDGLRHARMLCADLSLAQVPPDAAIVLRPTISYTVDWRPWLVPHTLPAIRFGSLN